MKPPSSGGAEKMCRDLHHFFHRLKIEKRYLFPLVDAKFDLKLLRALSLAELEL